MTDARARQGSVHRAVSRTADEARGYIVALDDDLRSLVGARQAGVAMASFPQLTVGDERAW